MKLRNRILVFLVCLISITNVVFVANAYTDVPEEHWAYEDITYVTDQGLMNGVGGNAFEPETTMDRAMLVTVLWRMEGSPTSSKATPFTDLSADWYKGAVAWAYECQIVNGVSADHFAPEEHCTREQLVTMLYRYSQACCCDTTERMTLDKFSDVNAVSGWAKTAVEWAYGAGLIKGIENNNSLFIEPQKSCTRAEASALIHRFRTNIDLKHVIVVDEAIPATCTINGLTEGSHCSVCNNILIAQTTVPATHQFKEATCSESMKCVNCGETSGFHNGHSFSGNWCTACGENLNDIFDVSYSTSTYLVRRSDSYAHIKFTNCSKQYYKYNDSVTLTVSARGEIIKTAFSGRADVISYKICLYKDGELYADKSVYLQGQKGDIDLETVYFYNVEPGTYTIKIG